MNNDDLFESCEKQMNLYAEESAKRNAEFQRLCAEPCYKVPVVGDRILFAAGFVGHGHLWVRREAVVTEIADTAVKVRFESHGTQYDEWIHNALVTDVLTRNGSDDQQQMQG